MVGREAYHNPWSLAGWDSEFMGAPGRDISRDGDVRWSDLSGAIGPSGDWSRNTPTTSRRQRSRGDKRPDEVVNETMELIGNRWSISILGATLQGMTRFSDIQRRLSASPTVVADRLRVFGQLGILQQVPSPARADRKEYRLTPKGKAFLPVALLMIEWGQRWFHPPDGPALLMTHAVCGAELTSRLTCSECREPLRGSTIETVRSGRGETAEPLL